MNVFKRKKKEEEVVHALLFLIFEARVIIVHYRVQLDGSFSSLAIIITIIKLYLQYMLTANDLVQPMGHIYVRKYVYLSFTL